MSGPPSDRLDRPGMVARVCAQAGLGLAYGEVVLAVDIGERWHAAYVALADELRSALRDDAAGIEHVGSTAVPGLVAKPVIDVVVGLAGDADMVDVTGKLGALGYEFRGDKGASGGVLFVLEDAPKHRVAHVHVVRRDDELWDRYLMFRDHLRMDPDARAGYASLKRHLAARHPHDRAAYTAGKEEAIARLRGRE
jgi:GrpB-like predicted nucleotidyltransferase (UPF0157 family)